MKSFNINPEPCDFNVGDIIDNKFRVKRRLGEGAFGIVYVVEDAVGDTYAVKLFKLWEVPENEREAIVNRLNIELAGTPVDSSYLLQPIYHNMVCGNPYIVMEYCSKGDILSIGQSVDFWTLAINVLRGLQALHSSGKVHRNLKPENVFVKDDGTFALSDFGIAGNPNRRAVKAGKAVDAFAFMAPEQMQQKGEATALPATDIFSFGVLMYQQLTFLLPFGTINDQSDLEKYLSNAQAGKWNRAALEAVHGGKRWVPLIEGCLNPDVKLRIQTAEEAIKLVPYGHASSAIDQEEMPPAPAFQTRIDNGLLLRVVHGENADQVFYLNDIIQRQPCGVVTVGRANSTTGNDIMLPETHSTYISRRHCTLELDDCAGPGQWVVRDGQFDPNTRQWRRSTNGTYVNSREAEAGGLPFGPGDIISVGDVKMRAEGY